jgi:hypothetical protein
MRKLAVLALVLAACGSKPHSGKVSDADASRLLTDRNWLDTWPEQKDDHLHVYRFTPAMGGGVYQDRTVFQGSFELFTYQVDGDHLTFTMPHTGEVVKTQYQIERVEGPAPFDLKLTLFSGPRGPAIYFGRSAEHAGDGLSL